MPEDESWKRDGKLAIFLYLKTKGMEISTPNNVNNVGNRDGQPSDTIESTKPTLCKEMDGGVK